MTSEFAFPFMSASQLGGTRFIFNFFVSSLTKRNKIYFARFSHHFSSLRLGFFFTRSQHFASVFCISLHSDIILHEVETITCAGTEQLKRKGRAVAAGQAGQEKTTGRPGHKCRTVLPTGEGFGVRPN
jgi:hypothetical protein